LWGLGCGLVVGWVACSFVSDVRCILGSMAELLGWRRLGVEGRAGLFFVNREDC